MGKCMFFYNQIEYLSHMIYLGKLGVQQTKVDAIAHIPHPTNTLAKSKLSWQWKITLEVL